MLPKAKGAKKPLKPCPVPRCPNKVKVGYCPDHSHLSTSQFRNKKGKVHPWYTKALYRKRLRPNQLRRNPLCEQCEKEGRITPATVCDHKKTWQSGRTKAEQWQLFADPDNHQSLCLFCHNSKTAKNNKVSN